MFVIIGLIVVFGSILGGYTMHHGNIAVLIQFSEFIIIGGGDCGTLREVLKLAGKIHDPIEHEYFEGRTTRSKFYKIEPTPLAIDLDGDGVDEVIVPQNIVKEGLIAIVFKGPAGFRLQSIDTGFEGMITALGGFKTDDANQPTIIATVVRYKNILKTQAETQVIMTVPQE